MTKREKLFLFRRRSALIRWKKISNDTRDAVRKVYMSKHDIFLGDSRMVFDEAQRILQDAFDLFMLDVILYERKTGRRHPAFD